MSYQENNTNSDDSPTDNSWRELRPLGDAAQPLFSNSGIASNNPPMVNSHADSSPYESLFTTSSYADPSPGEGLSADSHADSSPYEDFLTTRSPTMPDPMPVASPQDLALPTREHFLDPNNVQLLPLLDSRTDARPHDVCPICPRR